MSADLHVMRARLTPSPKFDKQQTAIHDFRNDLAALMFAAREQNDSLSRFYMDELASKYAAALAPGKRTRPKAKAAWTKTISTAA